MIAVEPTFILRNFLTPGEKRPDMALVETRIKHELALAPRTGVHVFLEVDNFRPDPGFLDWVRRNDTIHIRTGNITVAKEWHQHLAAAQNGETL